MSSEREEKLWRTNTNAAYAEAERRIKKAIADGSPELKLSDLWALVRLPPEIAQCGLLKRLRCNSTRITDDDLAHLTPLTGLERLTLSGTQISDAGLAHLTPLTGLQMLNLSGTQIGDAGLAHLKPLTRLRVLTLQNTQIRDAGLEHLSPLTRLEILILDNTRIGDAGLAHLAPLTGLQILDLRGTRIGDAGMPHLTPLTGLRTLDLSGTLIGDAGLAHLAPLKGLQSLNLLNTRVRDLRILLEFSGLRDNGNLIWFRATPALKLTPLQRFQGNARDLNQINQLLDVLRKEFPPYPIPFDEDGNAVEEATEDPRPQRVTNEPSKAAQPSSSRNAAPNFEYRAGQMDIAGDDAPTQDITRIVPFQKLSGLAASLRKINLPPQFKYALVGLEEVLAKEFNEYTAILLTYERLAFLDIEYEAKSDQEKEDQLDKQINTLVKNICTNIYAATKGFGRCEEIYIRFGESAGDGTISEDLMIRILETVAENQNKAFAIAVTHVFELLEKHDKGTSKQKATFDLLEAIGRVLSIVEFVEENKETVLPIATALCFWWPEIVPIVQSFPAGSAHQLQIAYINARELIRQRSSDPTSSDE